MKPIIVYAIVSSYDYEGYNVPEGIYADRKMAELAMPKGRKQPRYEVVEVPFYAAKKRNSRRRSNPASR